MVRLDTCSLGRVDAYSPHSARARMKIRGLSIAGARSQHVALVNGLDNSCSICG